MFRRELYRAMARVLDALEPQTLEHAGFRFGGGTRIALAHGEFRLSRDLDFVCSDGDGYAELRLDVRERGYDALFTPSKRAGLGLPREVRSDQYGMRFPVLVDGASIRVELIREARIALGAPEHAPWTAVPLLSTTDVVAEKLLANSDRGSDRDTLARDLVDLAILRLAHGPIADATWRQVERAYRSAPRSDLAQAAERFVGDAAFAARCFGGLGIEDGETVLRGVRALLADLHGA
ncbi:MAG: nucleotidyl transferase AbiEii/AbiGii toxin family protein [Myxococcales bacterium]|nr:nucleotidyl transferase AbiEii/AbiGii toxin family protein [Myxococcales bacterium]